MVQNILPVLALDVLRLACVRRRAFIVFPDYCYGFFARGGIAESYCRTYVFGSCHGFTGLAGGGCHGQTAQCVPTDETQFLSMPLHFL